MFPALKLRLNDEAELMGTDWAEMGERAYAYLPFEESQSHRSSREDVSSTNSTDNDKPQVTCINDSSSTTVTSSMKQKKKNNPFKGIKKLMMTNDKTVIKGVPDLIEEPVILDYNQQKDLGAIHMHEIIEPTGGDLYQKTQAQIREENQGEEDIIHSIGHPMTEIYIDESNTPTTSSSSSNSSGKKQKSKV